MYYQSFIQELGTTKNEHALYKQLVIFQVFDRYLNG